MEREIDKDGLYLCPKCTGKGKMVYSAYDVPDIIRTLYFLKKSSNKTKPKLGGYISFGLRSYIVHRVTLLCPICEGKGKIDWIVNTRVGVNVKKFNKYFGCFSPIWSWCDNNGLTLGRQFKIHQVGRNSFANGIMMKEVYYNNQFITQDLIKKSQKRFIGPIIINENIFSLSRRKLKNIYDKIENHQKIFWKNDYSPKAVKEFLIKEKLLEYLPPIFAVRDPEDFFVK
jgi:hypothetical protein